MVEKKELTNQDYRKYIEYGHSEKQDGGCQNQDQRVEGQQEHS